MCCLVCCTAPPQKKQQPQSKRLNVKWLCIKEGNLWGLLPMKASWWLGFTLLVIVPLPSDFAALALASQSIIYPAGAATTVLVGQVVAPTCFFKNEKLTWVEWTGSALIVIGAVLASAFGAQNNQSYVVDDIVGLYGETPFLILLGVTSLFFVIAIYVAHIHERLKPAWGMAAVTFIPSYLCGVQTISFKSMSELTANALGANNTEGSSNTLPNEWGSSFLPYVFILVVLCCCVMQLIYINLGGERYQATRYFPAYNACLMVCTCTFGAVFYKEYTSLHPVFFPLGLVIICAGITFIAWRDPTDRSTVVPLNDEDGDKSVDDGHRSGSGGDIVTPGGSVSALERPTELKLKVVSGGNRLDQLAIAESEMKISNTPGGSTLVTLPLVHDAMPVHGPAQLGDVGASQRNVVSVTVNVAPGGGGSPLDGNGLLPALRLPGNGGGGGVEVRIQTSPRAPGDMSARSDVSVNIVTVPASGHGGDSGRGGGSPLIAEVVDGDSPGSGSGAAAAGSASRSTVALGKPIRLAPIAGTPSNEGQGGGGGGGERGGGPGAVVDEAKNGGEAEGGAAVRPTRLQFSSGEENGPDEVSVDRSPRPKSV